MNYFMQEQFNFIFFAEPQDLIFKNIYYFIASHNFLFILFNSPPMNSRLACVFYFFVLRFYFF